MGPDEALKTWAKWENAVGLPEAAQRGWNWPAGGTGRVVRTEEA
jgi:hypothetical protein